MKYTKSKHLRVQIVTENKLSNTSIDIHKIKHYIHIHIKMKQYTQ